MSYTTWPDPLDVVYVIVYHTKMIRIIPRITYVPSHDAKHFRIGVDKIYGIFFIIYIITSSKNGCDRDI